MVGILTALKLSPVAAQALLWGSVALVVVGSIGFGVHEHDVLQKAKAQAAAVAKADKATVATAQATTDQAAQKIVVAGEATQHLDIQVHQTNAEAIAQVVAPSVDVPISPDLVGTVNLGLCRYPDESVDPRCPGLLKVHP